MLFGDSTLGWFGGHREQIRNMQSHRTLPLALILGCSALVLSHAQVTPRESVSSDDISVAEGLQLPTYGHVWALDTWKGVRELVRLKPPDTTADDSGFSLKMRRTIEFKGEAALVRVHDAAPLFFLRGVSGSDNGRSDLVVVRLNVETQRRDGNKRRHGTAQAAGQTWGRPVSGCDRHQAATGGNDGLVPAVSKRKFSRRANMRLSLYPPAPALQRARFSTLPSIPRRRKTPILCAQNSIAAPNESHPPITPRC